MRIHTLFLTPMPEENARFVLPKEEAEHLFKVFRAEIGDEVELLDGEGRRGRAEVLPERALCMKYVEKVTAPEKEFHLYCALPRHNKQDDLLRQAAESGVAMIHPVRFARSVAQSEASPRWEVLLREACKQSKNPFLPKLDRTLSLDEALDDAGKRSLAVCFGSIIPAPEKKISGVRGGAWFVGPEGGFTDGEVARMVSRGGVGVNLGPWVMRLETAAVAGIAVLRKILCVALLAFFLSGCGEKDVAHTALMVKGNKYRESGDTELAEKFFRRAANKYPDAPEPLLALASLYDEELQDSVAALFFYREYLKKIPADHPDRALIEAYRDRLESSLHKTPESDEMEKLKKENLVLRRMIFRLQTTIRNLQPRTEEEKSPRPPQK